MTTATDIEQDWLTLIGEGDLLPPCESLYHGDVRMTMCPPEVPPADYATTDHCGRLGLFCKTCVGVVNSRPILCSKCLTLKPPGSYFLVVEPL